MKVVILAAGRGERMSPLTDTIPKPLLKVGGKTFLDHILSSLPRSVSEVILVIGYKGGQIRKYIGKKYGSKNIFYVMQRERKGTGHGLMLTKPFFKEHERFFIIYGDEPPTRGEIRACLRHRYSWMCREVTDPAVPVGVVKIGKNKIITGVIERPLKQVRPCISGGGVFLVDSDIFRFAPTLHRTGEYYLTSMMNEFLKYHKVYATKGRKDLYFHSLEDIDRHQVRI